MSYQLYKVLHILAVLLTFVALGGMTLRSFGRADSDNDGSKLAGATHGVALALILITGFGMLARLGLGFPTWVWLKVAIWLLIGASIALIRRLPNQAIVFWFALPLLGSLAAYLAIYKPGG